jgi:putative aminopeptidase FrvX
VLLKKLSEAFGPPGQEDEVRSIIREKIAPHVDRIWTDTMGNLYAEKKGRQDHGPRVMLAAHMDEVALMITRIDKKGFLYFKTLGGIDQRILVAKPVVIGRQRVPGVIGAKAVHLLEPEERKKAFSVKELYIDIGAKDKEEAEKLVSIGEGAVFHSHFCPIGVNRVRGKALDDRAGCAALVELLQYDYPISLTAVFTVQEEVGLRGGRIAAFSLKPDLALVLETTTAADVPEIKSHQMATCLGKGPALTIMDRTLIADQDLLIALEEIAQSLDKPYQWKQTVTGGTDGGAIHLTEAGIPTAVVAIPCRYLHSPASVIDLTDYRHLLELIHGFLIKAPGRRTG